MTNYRMVSNFKVLQRPKMLIMKNVIFDIISKLCFNYKYFP